MLYELISSVPFDIAARWREVHIRYCTLSKNRMKPWLSRHVKRLSKTTSVGPWKVCHSIRMFFFTFLINNSTFGIYSFHFNPRKKKKEKTEILAKNVDKTQKHITAVKHWSPPSFYCSALPDICLVFIW